MEHVHFAKPNKEEIARRKTLVKNIFANRDKLVIAPLTSVDLVRMSREENESNAA